VDRDTYQGLIERLEAESENRPAAYRTKVVLLSAAAYAVLFATLIAVALAIAWGLEFAYAKHSTVALVRLAIFALILVPVVFVVLRVFFTRLRPPSGRVVERAEAPKLFDVLDKMRRRLKGPPIHRVLLDGDFNASIVQLPRWGLFGGHRNYLVLGVPFLIGLPPKEMLATVAHEYGHLCGNHGKLGAWVYRQRRTFLALYEQVGREAQSNWFHGAIAGALDRFMPVYDAYTFVLSRQDEYKADQTATEIVGADANASGLIRGALLGRFVHDEFWPRLWSQADAAARPAYMPFAAMRAAFDAGYAQWATKERLQAAWEEAPKWHDTHPSLRERVEATGQQKVVPPRATAAAGDALLGNAKSLIDEFDRVWWSEQQQQWQSRFRYAERSKLRLRELSSAPRDTLAVQDLQELALLTAEFDSPEAAKPALEALLKRSGGPFPKAAFVYGRILLDEGVDRGLDHLVAAAAADRSLIDAAAEAGYRYVFDKRGEHAAHAFLERLPPGAGY